MTIKNQLTALVILFATLSHFAFADNHQASECQTRIVPGDEIWLISARDFDGCSDLDTSQMQVQCFCDGQWSIRSFEQLQQTNDTKQDIVYVHGYRTDLLHAQHTGLVVYQNLFASIEDRQTAVRYIIWAWKSERESRRLAVDFNMKSQRAVALGGLFAQTINALGEHPASVIGYSLGAQVVVSAFVQSSCYQGQPIKVAIIAAANDCRFQSCFNEVSKCGNIDKSVVFYNEGDLAIRAAKIVCRCRYRVNYQSFHCLVAQHQCALGDVDIVDISDVSSRRHSVIRYTSIAAVQDMVQQTLLPKDD